MAETRKTKEKIEKEDKKEITPETKETQNETGKTETKKIVPEKKSKTKIEINANNLRISTKHSVAICRFIKNKKIQEAISELGLVAKLKKPVPMKGEIPHRKGKIMSGRFPKKAAENFIKVLKNALATSSSEGIENPVVLEASANIGSRPYGRFGRTRKKRTHLKIIAGIKENKK